MRIAIRHASIKGKQMESLTACPSCSSTRRGARVSVKERLLGEGETFTVLQCEGCGLFWTDPRPVKEEIGCYYPEHYAPYQPSDATETPWLSRGLKGTIRRWTLTAHLGYRLADLSGLRHRVISTLTRPLKGRYVEFPRFRQGGVLLEVGCATGEGLALLRSLGWCVQGVEISEQACRVAKDRYGLDIFCGELEKAGLPDVSVDAVLMSHLIEHVHDPIATLREVRRILRPGGVVVMATPNVESLERRVFRQYWYDWDVPRHLFLFSARTLGNCCARAGLRVTRVGYSSYAGDWIRSLAYWCRDHQWRRLAQWLHSRPRALTLLLVPLCKLLAWVGATGRMTVVAMRE